MFLHISLHSSLPQACPCPPINSIPKKYHLRHFTSSKILHAPLSNLRQLSSSSRPFPAAAGENFPARDRVIDFGKHRGRMLGSLLSTYLSWISSNLRAGDFEHWACLADEVLADSVYRDRIEWESAGRLLSGAPATHSRNSDSPIADLLALSDSFGWDYQDKEAWARIDFELLGTSLSGRIPRRAENGEKSFLEMGRGRGGKGIRKGWTLGTKVGGLRDGRGFAFGGEVEEEASLGMKERRLMRMERRRLGMEGRRERRVGMQEFMKNGGDLGEEGENERSDNGLFLHKKRTLSDESDGGRFVNPFPGRGAMLEKIKRRGG